MTKPKRYKRFSSEFKREAIMRASEEGMTSTPQPTVCELRLPPLYPGNPTNNERFGSNVQWRGTLTQLPESYTV